MSIKLHIPHDGFIPELYPKGSITQWYGEHPELYSKSVCYAGVGCLKAHNGVDSVAPYGTPIYAVAGGMVVEVGNQAQGYGNVVRILDDNDFEWTYGHNSKIVVTPGQLVKAGDKIAEMGNTGFVVSGDTQYWKDNPYAGTHLHLGKREVKRWVSGSWNITYLSGTANEIRGVIQNFDNGFFGALPIVAEDFPGYTPPSPPRHLFKRNLEYGMTKDSDVIALQDILRYEGLFTSESTGNYFSLTAQAVKQYQLRYGLVTQWQALTYQGRYVYEITRAHLNKKYGG